VPAAAAPAKQVILGYLRLTAAPAGQVRRRARLFVLDGCDRTPGLVEIHKIHGKAMGSGCACGITMDGRDRSARSARRRPVGHKRNWCRAASNRRWGYSFVHRDGGHIVPARVSVLPRHLMPSPFRPVHHRAVQVFRSEKKEPHHPKVGPGRGGNGRPGGASGRFLRQEGSLKAERLISTSSEKARNVPAGPAHLHLKNSRGRLCVAVPGLVRISILIAFGQHS